MTVRIQDFCIRCGMCVDLCPNCFSFNFEEDRIDLLPPALEEANYEQMKQMALDCAVGAILVKKEK